MFASKIKIYKDIYTHIVGFDPRTIDIAKESTSQCLCFIQKDKNRIIVINHHHADKTRHCLEENNEDSVFCNKCEEVFNISAKTLKFIAKMALFNR